MKVSTTQPPVFLIILGLFFAGFHEGYGVNPIISSVSPTSHPAAPEHVLRPRADPFVESSIPADGATGVDINESVSTDKLFLPDGLDMERETINETTVLLYQLGEDDEIVARVPGRVGDTGGGDGIRFDPSAPLLPTTQYRFVVTEGVTLTDGTAFIPFAATFTTGDGQGAEATLPGVAFVPQPATADDSGNDYFTTLVIGPDQKLYASTIGGQIKRWTIRADGTLSDVEVLVPPLTSSRPDGTSGQEEARTIVGLAFAPEATADNPIVYITHSKQINFNRFSSDPLDWDGKVSRLTGSELQTVEDVVVRLPRSLKDHLTNSLVFDPRDPNVLYISQGSNSGGGTLDEVWKKTERLLSGAILKLDLRKLPAAGPLDARTTDDISVINNASATSPLMSDGTYNPYATASPLTIFASGVRNAYDLVWHRNGELYVPTNGTGGGSRTPGSGNYVDRDPSGKGVRRITGEFYTHQSFPAVEPTVQNKTQKDWLFRVVENGYYGHPNPYRGEFVMNHGGRVYQGLPGQAEPHIDVDKYPTSTIPDPNYREAAYDFGFNKSPNGVIEYRSNAFGGALQGMLLVTRFSNGNDIILLEPDLTGQTIRQAYVAIPGLSNLDDPLDLVEDPTTGNLYVSQYDRNGTQPVLTLLRVATGEEASPAPMFQANVSELVLESIVGETDRATVTVTNAGTAPLPIADVSIRDDNAGYFSVEVPADGPLPPDGRRTYSVAFDPGTTSANMGFNSAQLVFTYADEAAPDTVALYALKKEGLAGTNEPPLQAVVRTLGIGIDVGWNGLTTGTDSARRGEEVRVPLFIRAGNGPVTMQPVARYSPAEKLPFGWYVPGDREPDYQRVGTLQDGERNAQTLSPPLDSGSLEFNPQQQAFGLYVYSQTFGRYRRTQDDPEAVIPHRARVYPARDRQGNLIANSYLLGFEDASNGDYQDYVFLLSNVKPAAEAAVPGAWLTVENMTKLPGTDRGFPADDFYSFHQLNNRLNPIEKNTIAVHDQNVMRLRNAGTSPLVISAIDIADTSEFVYAFEDPATQLPFTLLPNATADLTLSFVKDEGFREVVQQPMTITSSSDSGQVVVTLSGAYMERADNRNEISARQAADALGFSTNFTNRFPIRGTFPTEEEVTDGIHGDLIVTSGLVAADAGQPVVVVQLAALHSYNDGNSPFIKLAQASDYQTNLPGSRFRHAGSYHQTILPRAESDEDQLAGVALRNVSDTFQVGIGPYYTGGGAARTSRKDELLGARTYRAVDAQGATIPNTYIIIQDYISASGNGCGGRDAGNNCDFNDNIVYITNVRPAERPRANPISDTTATVDSLLTYDVSPFFERGYWGNQLTYTLETVDGPATDWLLIDPETGVVTGTPGRDAPASLVVEITATDANGWVVQSDFSVSITGVVALPTVTSLGDQVNTKGDTLDNRPVVSVAGTDAELVYQATGLPAGLAMDSASGRVSGVVTAEPNDYPVIVSVAFESDSVVAALQWTVLPMDTTVADTTVTSVVEPPAEQAVTLYPNPTDGELWITFAEDEPPGEVTIVITDARGRQWLHLTQPLGGTNPLRLTTADLPPALYTVRVVKGDTVTTRKLVKRY